MVTKLRASKQLILMRHGKSDWHSRINSDHDRPLNDRGCRDAQKAGQWLSINISQPSIILCSSAVRTCETLELLQRSSKWGEACIETLPDLYLAGEFTILELIGRSFQQYDRVMVIGHNPGMDGILNELCPEASRNQSGKLMTTASFAVIDMDNGALENPVLLEFRRPGDLL